jgi:probable F420-dependent oxidoreductase
VSTALPTLGLRLPNSGPFATPEAILRVAATAERLGYDTAWVHDHISWPQHELTHFATGSLEACTDQDANFYESIASLGVLGGMTKRIRLGIAGLVLPLRDPRVLAKQLTTLDRLTGGRITVAIGSGAKEHDFEVMGVPWSERGKIMSDSLAALRAITRPEQPVSYEGSPVSFRDGTFYPLPEALRIWIAGRSGPALSRAVRYGDGVLTHVLAPDEYAELYSDVRRRLDEAKRDPTTFDTALELFACIAPTHEDAVAISARSLGRRSEDQVAANLVGTPDEALEKLARYRASGVTHVELRMICHSVEQLEEMAASVTASAATA